MKKLNILFSKEHDDSISELAESGLISKSTAARAAMSAGIIELSKLSKGMSDREFHKMILEIENSGCASPKFLVTENDINQGGEE